MRHTPDRGPRADRSSDAKTLSVAGGRTTARSAISLMNGADAIIRAGGLSPSLGVVPIDVITHSAGDPWNTPAPQGGVVSMGGLLSAFRDALASEPRNSAGDWVLLTTGQPTSSRGLAFVSGVCTGSRASVAGRGPDRTLGTGPPYRTTQHHHALRGT